MADFSPYVAACARTRTPPAQRLGLRGESEAILSSVFDSKIGKELNFSMTAAFKLNFISITLMLTCTGTGAQMALAAEITVQSHTFQYQNL